MRNQDELKALVREILGDTYIGLSVPRYMLKENLETHEARINCDLRRSGADELAIEGQGVGMIDALFSGLKASLSEEYPSLNHIHFVDFHLDGDFTSPACTDAHSDALGKVHLAVENTHGRRFSFESSTCSISASSVQAVVKAVEHFVNAELAVLRVYDWIDDAKRRSRPDLAAKYVQRLADLVANASYSETIERRKKDSA